MGYLKRLVKKVYGGSSIYDSYIYRHVCFPIARCLAMHGYAYPLMANEREYWSSRQIGHEHGPEKYIKEDIITFTAFSDLLEVVNDDASFLEIGCNAGRHLNYLLEKGYRKLGGIEINEDSISKMMKDVFPELYEIGKFYIGNAAEEIKRIPDNSYDVTFSIAVLEHIHPEDISLFKDMVRVTKKYVAVMTTENSKVGPYDFGKLFENLGCKTILFRLFYGKDHNFHLPCEKYNDKKHFFNSTFLRIFVKTSKD